MDNRKISFSISNKNVGAWVSAALMLAAVLLRIALAANNWLETLLVNEGSFNGWALVLLCILPVIAAIAFAAELIGHGRDRLYKTSFPVLMGAGFFIARIAYMFADPACASVTQVWHLIGCIVLYIAAAVIWDLTVNAFRIRTKLPALLIFLLPFIVHLFVLDLPLWLKGNAALPEVLREVSVLLIMASLAVVSIFMSKKSSDKFRPRRGDRPDGRLIRSLDPINGVAIYIMPNRNGAAVYFRDTIECSKLEDYIRRKRAEGLDGFGTLHVIAAAYVRVISQRPACNRFISGQRIFSRDGEIELSMVVKKDMTAEAPETIITVYFDPNDTAEDVYRKYNEQVVEAKGTALDSGFDKLAGLVNLVPGVVKKFLIWLLKTADYFGLLPRWIMRLSPFHGSVFVTALGSLGVPPVFHHLYDFGNIPVFIAFGARHTETETGDDGAPVKRKYVDYTIVLDERICDGFYYASAFKLFRRYLNNPDKLDTPPESVVEDVF